jgi:HK97 family phage prohead protease
MDIRFAGYASVFAVPDKGGDVVAPGAFGTLPARLPLLWQHDSREPIGFVESLSTDQRGLRVIGRVIGSGRGQQAADLVIGKALDGLSFGYRVRSARSDRLRGVRELTGLELIEISLVTFPMQPLARVLAAEPVNPEETNP